VAVLFGVELEDVADQHDEDGDEDEERDRGERGKGYDLLDTGWIESLEPECVERSKPKQQDEDSCGEGDDPKLALIGGCGQNATSIKDGCGRKPASVSDYSLSVFLGF
jgi:hypothetical protein